VTFNQPTMNIDPMVAVNETELRRVVLHEFGHAFGAIHEHQNPKGGIEWNEKAVYKFFGGPPNYWTRRQVDQNVFRRFQEDHFAGTEFDPDSIMAYWIPKELTKNGMEIRPNYDLSLLDRIGIANAYPLERVETTTFGEVKTPGLQESGSQTP